MRALLAAVLSSTVSILPLQILGASAVLVREELHFGAADLGFAIAAFFTAWPVVTTKRAPSFSNVSARRRQWALKHSRSTR